MHEANPSRHPSRRTRAVTMWAFLAVGLGIYLTMLLVTVPRLTHLSGGLSILDMRPGGYDEAAVRELLEQLGPEGREYYLTTQLPLDMLYPGIFATGLVLAGQLLLERLHLRSRRWHLAALSLAGWAVADYLENACAIITLASYPELPGMVVAIGSAASTAKSALAPLTPIAVAAITAITLLRRRHHPSRSQYPQITEKRHK